MESTILIVVALVVGCVLTLMLRPTPPAPTIIYVHAEESAPPPMALGCLPLILLFVGALVFLVVFQR